MFLKKLKKAPKNFFKLLQMLIMPKSCVICNKIIYEGDICAADFGKLHFISDPKCQICSQPFEFEVVKNGLCAICLTKRPKYDMAICVLDYNETCKKLVFDLKYHDKTRLSNFFAYLMFKGAKKIIDDIDFVTPIALHKKRLRKRKFNHSALIAKDFCKIAKLPLIFDLLIRQKNTKAQYLLNKTGRKRNITGAFKFNDKYLETIKNKNILIIDDVITTGVTIAEYCKILRKFKVGKIYVLTLAKTSIN